MNRAAQLYSSSELTVNRFDHARHEPHADPAGEIADSWGIAFVQAGSFAVIREGVQRTLGPGAVFLTRPGLEFTCAHETEFPDDVCISIRFDAAAVAGCEHSWERSPTTHTSAPPRLAYVQRRMTQAVALGERLEIERWAVSAMTALATDADTGMTRGPYAHRVAVVDAVVETCRNIERDPIAARDVGERAADVGFTSPQLTHAFRRYLGLSPHQYVIRWRLAAAAEMLDDGSSVSDTCYRAGFENLSHFCRSFRRTFDVRPSEWRRLPLGERGRKVQALTGIGR